MKKSRIFARKNARRILSSDLDKVPGGALPIHTWIKTGEENDGNDVM